MNAGRTPPAPAEFNADERELDRLEPAWADFVFGWRTGLRIMRDTDAAEKVRTRSLLDVDAELEGYRRRHEAGDTAALLAALLAAMDENLPVPYWVSTDVRARLRRVLALQGDAPTSLHQAFDLADSVPLSPKRWAAAKQDLQRELRLWREVHRAMAKGLSLDRALAAAAAPLGLGKTKARELFLRRDAIQTAADTHGGFRRFGRKREKPRPRRA